MMMRIDDGPVRSYLHRLERELGALPRSKRAEIVDEIREHIDEAIAVDPPRTEADLRNLLDRIGDPSEIAAEARDRFGIGVKAPGTKEVITVPLLLFGGVIIPVLGWIAGVVLLWLSDVWTTRDKLIGTFVVPGGLTAAIAMLFLPASVQTCGQDFDARGHLISSTCTGGLPALTQTLLIVLFAVLLIAPIATTIYLSRRLGQARRATEARLTGP